MFLNCWVEEYSKSSICRNPLVYTTNDVTYDPAKDPVIKKKFGDSAPIDNDMVIVIGPTGVPHAVWVWDDGPGAWIDVTQRDTGIFL